VCELVGEKLGVDGSRVYLAFTNVPSDAWGTNGCTFG
jgi:phenylpyruvate tautomerase PptA (4-oxalocrotonate tautomerase family)